MLVEQIDSYYKSNIFKPLYVTVSDDEYIELRDTIINRGISEVVYISSYCKNIDKKPDLDRLRELLRTADVDCDSNKITILGLGEYLALSGSKFAFSVLNELKDYSLGTAHVVFLLRGVNSTVRKIAENDPRFNSRQVIFGKDEVSNLRFKISSTDLRLYQSQGIKGALTECEKGVNSEISFNSDIVFAESLFPVEYYKDAYMAICKRENNFNVKKEVGTEEYWEQLLKEIRDKGRIINIYNDNGFSLNQTSLDIYSKVGNSDYRCWLYYIFLVQNKENIDNSYLRFVIDNTSGPMEFRKGIMYSIFKIKHTDKHYERFYEERKSLLKSFPESEIAVFVSDNRLDTKESIYRLTDNTLSEKREIISIASKEGIPENLDLIYPDLSLYLEKYYFKNVAQAELLTEYFDQYKKQKVTNKINDDFIEKVDNLAKERIYNRLQARNELVSEVRDSMAFLCWIDALGVEYLSFIEELAKKRGLAVNVNIGRASLPTLTYINKQFYEDWPNSNKRKVESLDEIKHKEEGGYKYGENNPYAIHLAKELDIIKSVVDEASTLLALKEYDKYVIASDHGASRLAVIYHKEEKYETDTKGEHSGRCCPSFPNYNLPFATEENGYIVLADYGRFKGSRKANVEVHGGASLEEVLVPVISLSLFDNTISITLVEANGVKVDYKTGAKFTLFVNKKIDKELSVSYEGHRFIAEKIDDFHFLVTIHSLKRAGQYNLDVFLGDELVSNIKLIATGAGASINSDFDDLF
ncbi:MAG: BREX-4 system phosphatase PglZ [Clostridia bacterium]|nr:BREX-4 system phosphatase PglZ [Clostridia bacterium]